MNKKILTLCFLIPMAALAADHAGQGHVYFGANHSGFDLTDLLGAGVGGEVRAYKWLHAGGDIGYQFTRSGSGFGLLSVNPSLHFEAERSQRIVPFFTGGYGMAFRGETLNLYNYGGGITYWFRDNLGLRLEVRNYAHRQERFLTAFRIGFSFR